MRYVVVTAIAVTLLLSGCAGTTSPPTPRSSSSAALDAATPIPNSQTFASDDTGFSISWDSDALASRTDPARPGPARRPDVIGLALEDRDSVSQPFSSPLAGGLYMVARRTSSPAQASPPPEAQARKLLTEVPSDDTLAPFLPDVQREGVEVSDFRTVTLGGASGYRATYTWPGGRAEYYLLFSGLDIYQIMLAVADDSRESLWPTLNAALQSFTVER